jgi:hypothetical protein
MLNLTPSGGDGAFLEDSPLQLGEIYGFTAIPNTICHILNIPYHWYGIVQAYYPSTVNSVACIEIQMLPLEDHDAVRLPLQALLAWIEDDSICIKHFPMGNLAVWNAQLAEMLVVTQELIDLITDNPELIEDWKLYCLYQPAEERVAATYDWLSAQTDWFDTPHSLIDWILLTYELLDASNHPGDSGDDSGGSLPVPAGE